MVKRREQDVRARREEQGEGEAEEGGRCGLRRGCFHPWNQLYLRGERRRFLEVRQIEQDSVNVRPNYFENVLKGKNPASHVSWSKVLLF